MPPDLSLNDKEYGEILQFLHHQEIVDIHNPLFSSEKIEDGMINNNFILSQGNNTLLLKVFAQNEKLPIDRRNVFELQQELAILGLAPMPIFLSGDNSIYCEKWISTCGNLKRSISHNDDITMLAESLYNLHTAYVSAPILQLEKHWKCYWQAKTSIETQVLALYEEMNQKWHDYKLEYMDEFVLCHNDLHISHVCDAEGPYFDWEYAALGCRYYDLESCAVINLLDKHQKEYLLELYANLANQSVKKVSERVRLVEPFVRFTNDLWYSTVQ